MKMSTLRRYANYGVFAILIGMLILPSALQINHPPLLTTTTRAGPQSQGSSDLTHLPYFNDTTPLADWLTDNMTDENT
ncbi:MAG: hypothetical protein ACTSWL_03300, partial [Promethearchaeota archaeon]